MANITNNKEFNKMVREEIRRRTKVGATQKKILLMLELGLSLSFTSSLNRRRRIWNAFHKEWEKINRTALNQAITRLYQSKLIDYREDGNGLIKVIITRAGKKKSLEYKLEKIKIPIPKKWDKKWRIIAFDVPHRFKKGRDALRFHLKRLGLRRLQKSLYIFPHDCENEIDFIIEIHDLRPFVRYIVADHIDNELHFKKLFNLI